MREKDQLPAINCVGEHATEQPKNNERQCLKEAG
jgi:hypothetical protein